MKTTHLFPILFLCLFSYINSYAQEGDKAYVIQLATYDNWEDFANNEQAFYTNTGTADNNIFAEEIGNRVKVYLLDSYQGGVEYFYAGSHLDKVLKTVKNNPNFKDAFRRSDVDFQNLIYYGDVFEKYKNNKTPTEYTSKGTNINATTSTGAKYKIQLGVFKEWKSLDFIADQYGLKQVDQNKATTLLSHDFTKVKNNVCRRYYYGEYNNKEAATAKMKALENASKRKLLLVKI
jgi:hypothetical protein